MLKYEYLYSIVYFLRMSIGFLCSPGLPSSARGPCLKKPGAVLIFRVVSSTAADYTKWRSIFLAGHYVQVAFYHARELCSL